jgi:hypothetical protein
MPTRLVHLVIDANDRHRLADFWAAALGWEKDDDDDEPSIAPPGYDYPDPAALAICFCPVPEPKTGKNRVHLCLATTSLRHQEELVGRLLALGATRAGIGQGDVPWEVLTDPEGNEFCVLPPRADGYDVTGIVNRVVIDTADPGQVRDFWQQATGWDVLEQADQAILFRSPKETGPFLVLLRNHDQKTVKNRMHTDVAPEPGEDQAEAVARLEAAGAVRTDVGQGDAPWVVLTAPDGNELCVLRPR